VEAVYLSSGIVTYGPGLDWRTLADARRRTSTRQPPGVSVQRTKEGTGCRLQVSFQNETGLGHAAVARVASLRCGLGG